MSEKALWSIDRVYIDQYYACDDSLSQALEFDPLCTVMGTEEEIKKAIDTLWNQPVIEDPMSPGTFYRPVEATKLDIRGVDLVTEVIARFKPHEMK